MSAPLLRLALPALLLAAGVRAAEPQQRPPPAHGESGGAITMPTVTAPGDPEVLAPERPPQLVPPGQQPPFAQQPPGAAALPAPAPRTTVALEAPIDPAQYVCGRGDVFELNFWGAQNFRQRLEIDLEGRSFVPRVGYVELVGKTLAEARTLVRRAVARRLPGVSFDLSLAVPRTFLVHVVGAVARPGTIEASGVERVSSVLRRAGGELPNASRRRIELEHRGGARSPVDLVLYELIGDTRLDPFPLDGDVIYVPFEGTAVTVTGGVNRPGRYELTRTRDLAEALSLAGGFSPTATRRVPLRLVRRGLSERREQREIPLSAEGPLPAIALQAEDAIEVPRLQELERTVLVSGALAGAAGPDDAAALRRMPFVQGDTVRTLIDRVGGVAPGADVRAAFVRSADESVVRVDLDGLLAHRDGASDRSIAPGDMLVVPWQKREVRVLGAVPQSGNFPYNPSLTIPDYVALAGGETRFADGDLRVLSAMGTSRPYTEGLRALPGDTVVVPERSFTRSEIVQLVISGVGVVLGGVALVVAVHH